MRETPKYFLEGGTQQQDPLATGLSAHNMAAANLPKHKLAASSRPAHKVAAANAPAPAMVTVNLPLALKMVSCSKSLPVIVSVPELPSPKLQEWPPPPPELPELQLLSELLLPELPDPLPEFLD